MSSGNSNTFTRQLRNVLRPIARRFGLAAPAGAWDKLGFDPLRNFHQQTLQSPHGCNICGWKGISFTGPFHCEMAQCPRCGSIARDRFLLECFFSRNPDSQGKRVLETSPRLGDPYRRMMRRYFDYLASDFDLSAHEGDIRIDLQNIDLPSNSVDVLLTPHVLEHVPSTRIALNEIHRVLSQGGKMYLQVPLCRGSTKRPEKPEFHADNTKVFFNFGWDLTEMIRSAGFEVRVLVTEEFNSVLLDRETLPTILDPEFDLKSIWEMAPINALEVITDSQTSELLGFLPAHQFVTWECVKVASS